MESRQHFVDVSNWFSFDAKFTEVTLCLPDKAVTKSLGWTMTEVVNM